MKLTAQSWDQGFGGGASSLGRTLVFGVVPRVWSGPLGLGWEPVFREVARILVGTMIAVIPSPPRNGGWKLGSVPRIKRWCSRDC